MVKRNVGKGTPTKYQAKQSHLIFRWLFQYNILIQDIRKGVFFHIHR
nr:MAG TPA_asm: hypothetical protein [Caudoviricetes sp.]